MLWGVSVGLQPLCVHRQRREQLQALPVSPAPGSHFLTLHIIFLFCLALSLRPSSFLDLR